MLKRIALPFAAGFCRIVARAPKPILAAVGKVLGAMIARDCAIICRATDTSAPCILVFNANRYGEDLEALAASGRLTIYSIPVSWIQRLPSLFGCEGQLPRDSYFRETDPKLLSRRAELQRFLKPVIEALSRRTEATCIVTPAIHYVADFEWAGAAVAAGIHFVAAHKEFTVIDKRHLPEFVAFYEEHAMRFQGSWIFVASEKAKRMFVDSGIAPPEKIQVVGIPRIDRIAAEDSPFRIRRSHRKQVTWFAFGHYAGGIPVGERRSHVFSKYDTEGFVQLFEQTLAVCAELAVANPDVMFKIKSKYPEMFLPEIERCTQKFVGRSLADIKNFELVTEQAPALIRDSDVVIGFSSTTLLEALILDRPAIVPWFAEALDRYREFGYLRDYKDAFLEAGSKTKLTEMVSGLLNQEEITSPISPERRQESLDYYLGFADGSAVEKFCDAIELTLKQRPEPVFSLQGSHAD